MFFFCGFLYFPGTFVKGCGANTGGGSAVLLSTLGLTAGGGGRTLGGAKRPDTTPGPADGDSLAIGGGIGGAAEPKTAGDGTGTSSSG